MCIGSAWNTVAATHPLIPSTRTIPETYHPCSESTVMADGRGGKITWWMIKYPYTKKNAQPYVYPLYQVCPKLTSYGCFSDQKNLHRIFFSPCYTDSATLCCSHSGCIVPDSLLNYCVYDTTTRIHTITQKHTDTTSSYQSTTARCVDHCIIVDIVTVYCYNVITNYATFSSAE